VNHLLRSLAPITDEAWTLIDDEARRSLKLHLAARQLVDFEGPSGWAHSAVSEGRAVEVAPAPLEGVEARLRAVRPLLELRVPFELQLSELANADRGATDLDLSAVIAAARTAALAEDGAIFHGYPAGGVGGIGSSSPHEPIAIEDDFGHYPVHIARAVSVLQGAGVGGPYAIALGTTSYTGVVETAEGGGYLVLEHLSKILGGPVVRAPAVQGAVVLSRRGGDFELTVGQDLSVGYEATLGETVRLYVEESFAFRVMTPEASIEMTHG
jgi:uncharacterized linocin/CFP29 family protein